MPTSDVQRMHQDEWLGALRSGGFRQLRGRLMPHGKDGGYIVGDQACALGVAYCVSGIVVPSYQGVIEAHLGVSDRLLEHVVQLNDGDLLAFDDIADWFKGERDACDGDLSDWKP